MKCNACLSIIYISLSIILFSDTDALAPDDMTLEQFNSEKTTVIERLQKASKQLDYLDPAWQKIMPGAIIWFEKNFSDDIKEINEWAIHSLDYAKKLASSIEKKENFITDHPNAKFPFWFEGKGTTGKHYRTNYWVQFPRDYLQRKENPLRIFLGGWWNIPFMENEPETSMLLVRPQPVGPGWDLEMLNTYLEEVKRIFSIDENRVYVHGGSASGFRTWQWAMNNPEHFAAISSVAGGEFPYRVPRLKNIPAWIFHGEKDMQVPPFYAETLSCALKECGGTVKLTLFPDADHRTIWEQIDYKELEKWFLLYKRSKEPIPPDPFDDFHLNKEGIGSIQITKTPPQQVVLLQVQKDQLLHYSGYQPLYHTIYKALRNSGLPARGLIERQILPSHEEGCINLLLPVQSDINRDNLPENLIFAKYPSFEAATFGVKGDEEKVERTIQSVQKKLNSEGKKTTGEVRVIHLGGTPSNADRMYKVSIILET